VNPEGEKGKATVGREGRPTSKGDGREEMGWKEMGREFPSKVKVSRIYTMCIDVKNVICVFLVTFLCF